APDLHTGTGNFSIPIAVPRGRGDLAPKLALAYSSGHGNGAFGLGVSLDLPAITRRTSKGIPTYGDEDVFLLAGLEELVLVDRAGDDWIYRPRTDAQFAKIVRHRTATDDHWVVHTKDGLVSTYGTPNVLGAD